MGVDLCTNASDTAGKKPGRVAVKKTGVSWAFWRDENALDQDR
jgi:hypothetical protein